MTARRTGAASGGVAGTRPRTERRPPQLRNGVTLLAHARMVLADARRSERAGERYSLAHLAALRAAAALFAERARPSSGRRRMTNAWVLVEQVAPELSEWAAYFAAGAAKRAAVEAGATRAVSDRDADDLMRAVEEFIAIVERSVGVLTPIAS